MAATEKDDWPIKNSPIHPLKLHALGVVTLYWNQCEMAFFTLISGALGIEANLAFALTHEMGDVALASRMREVIALSPHSVDVNADVLHALQIYDVNRFNRNQLTHFLPAPSENGLALWRQKGPTLNPQPFPNELEDLRRVANEISTCRDYLLQLGLFFLVPQYGNARRTLPKRPPVPKRLWMPPPPSQLAPERPLRPSRG
jgi:hypothetical protein